MKKLLSILFAAVFVFALSGCGSSGDLNSSDTSGEGSLTASTPDTHSENNSIPVSTVESSEGSSPADSSKDEVSKQTGDPETNTDKGDMTMTVTVNGHTLKAVLADTQAARELAALIKEKPITLTLNEYGSFEKVGKLPQSFTRSDERITAQPCDIMLYQGDQMTIFYGENTWSYTRLGKIEDITTRELAGIFGSGSVEVTLG